MGDWKRAPIRPARRNAGRLQGEVCFERLKRIKSRITMWLMGVQENRYLIYGRKRKRFLVWVLKNITPVHVRFVGYRSLLD